MKAFLLLLGTLAAAPAADTARLSAQPGAASVVPPELSPEASPGATSPSAPVTTPDDATGGYTFRSDRAFLHPADLLGYTFVPRGYAWHGQYHEVGPGSIQLAFADYELKVTGVDGLETFHLADVQKAEFGFFVELIDHDRPSVPLVMMLLTDRDGLAHRLILHTIGAGRHEFVLPEREDADRRSLDSLFTNAGEIRVEGYDSLVGQAFVPYLAIPDIARERGFEQLDGTTRLVFGRDSMALEADSAATEIFGIRRVHHYASGQPGVAGTRYRIDLELKQEGVRGRKGRHQMKIFLDSFHGIEYLALGRARYYPRP